MVKKVCSLCNCYREDYELWFQDKHNDVYICNKLECRQYLQTIQQDYRLKVRPRKYIKTNNPFMEYEQEPEIIGVVENYEDYVLRRLRVTGTQVKLDL